jgi:predicted  nucleic acid-binding Zn-ribbon protein
VQRAIEDLSELQKIDLEVFRIDTQLKELPDKLADLKTHLDRIYGIIDRERKQMADDDKYLLELQQEVMLQNELLNKSKGKMAGARNEREVNAAQREVDMIKGAIQVREKEILQLLETVETLKKSITAKEEQFHELEEAFKTREAETTKQVDQLQSERAAHIAQRAAIEKRVPRETLSLYDRIRRRKPQAMVEVIEGNCQGCHLQIPPQIYNEVQRGERVLQCPNCTRIIYWHRPANRQPAENDRSA